MNIGNWIQRQSKLTIYALATFLFLVDEYIDYLTGPELNVSYFHLVPIFLIVWNSSFLPGIFYAFFCSCVILYVSLHSFSILPTGVQTFNAVANFVFLAVFSLVLGFLKKYLDAVTFMAEVDGLTNLLNSRSFERRAHQEIQASVQKEQPFTIVYIDVDNFKKINDTLGHNAGDEVLRSVGTMLNEHFRKNDLRTRIGGDEFAILLPGLSFEEAKIEIPKFHQKLNLSLGKHKVATSCSIGSVTFHKVSSTVKDALHEADMLMYQVKMNGKSHYLLKTYSPIGPES